jgi:hypothetical protein|tara:strand:- start:1377 stop:1784 length:408 start_codon:yes stop_codon:yes gene_type:complete
MSQSLTLFIPVAPSELLDKIAVLEIKSEKITNPQKLESINHELRLLLDIRKKHITESTELESLYQDLKEANLRMWTGLDEWEAYRNTYGIDVKLAKIVDEVQRQNNAERFPVKRKIDILLGSLIREEKSYSINEK